MTVFNHFPRMEDLFFDRDEEGCDKVREALRNRDPRPPDRDAAPPCASTRRRGALSGFSSGSRQFMQAVSGSETLKARARAIRDELAAVIVTALAESVGMDAPDPDAHLAASIVLAASAVAFVDAHDAYRKSGNPDEARLIFLTLVDRGARGSTTAMQGTSYGGDA